MGSQAKASGLVRSRGMGPSHPSGPAEGHSQGSASRLSLGQLAPVWRRGPLAARHRVAGVVDRPPRQRHPYPRVARQPARVWGSQRVLSASAERMNASRSRHAERTCSSPPHLGSHDRSDGWTIDGSAFLFTGEDELDGSLSKHNRRIVNHVARGINYVCSCLTTSRSPTSIRTHSGTSASSASALTPKPTISAEAHRCSTYYPWKTFRGTSKTSRDEGLQPGCRRCKAYRDRRSPNE